MLKEKDDSCSREDKMSKEVDVVQALIDDSRDKGPLAMKLGPLVEVRVERLGGSLIRVREDDEGCCSRSFVDGLRKGPPAVRPVRHLRK